MSVMATAMRQHLQEVRSKVEANCDYVGDKFADEARKIHYGETEARGIYGEATDQQHQELVEEGVEVARIPWLPGRTLRSLLPSSLPRGGGASLVLRSRSLFAASM